MIAKVVALLGACAISLTIGLTCLWFYMDFSGKRWQGIAAAVCIGAAILLIYPSCKALVSVLCK